MPAFEWVHAAPSAKGDDKFITTDYLQQCRKYWSGTGRRPTWLKELLDSGLSLDDLKI
ncbi:H-NS family nucleoid-associated regulatory protein [Enterobacter kobei]|uniref:H-NS family nucleoid-associated regulatory protein n=1 Tax=Enterobacter kobei TaxID=208224 RepID=UPI00388F553F